MNPWRLHGRFASESNHDLKLDIQSRVDDDLGNKERQIAETQKLIQSKNSESIQSTTLMADEKSTTEFAKAIKNAKDSQSKQNQWRVDAHDEQDYIDKKCKCYSTSDGSTVAVTADGDIISVCAHSSAVRGTGSKLMAFAVQHGGKKLDSFSGNHGFYTKCGFEPVSWTPFSVEYAPDGWKESGCPQEPVIFYKYVGVGRVNPDYMGFQGLINFCKSNPAFRGENGYDDAMAYRDKKMGGNKK